MSSTVIAMVAHGMTRLELKSGEVIELPHKNWEMSLRGALA